MGASRTARANGLRAHPAASLFPLLDGDELRALADDIRARGLLHPGVTLDGLLLDGRNRQAACGLAGVAFKTETLARCDSPARYVLSANLKRRHLTPLQRAAVAVKAKPLFAEEAKARQRAAGGDRKSAEAKAAAAEAMGMRVREGVRLAARIGSGQTGPNRSGDDGRATAAAAKATGAGTTNTRALDKIARDALDVFAAVEAGLIEKVSEAKAVAKMPTDQRAEALKRIRAGSGVKAAFREVRAEATAKAVAQAKRKTDRYHVIRAAIADAHAHVAADTVDLILTDPPYEQAAVPLFGDLARFAGHALKPGGSLLVMTGQMYLPDWLAQLATAPELAYHWTIAYLLPGGQSSSAWSRAANNFWKPVFWFVNGDAKPEGKRGDVVKSDVNDNDKRFHGWGQSESGFSRLVEGWSKPGDIVCDPFCGGGTTGAVALRLGRRFVGLDADKGCVTQTLARLRAET